jgi:hypothetical protein
MIRNLNEYYLLKDVPDMFKRYSELVDLTNSKRLEKYIDVKKSSTSKKGPENTSDDHLLMLLVCLLYMNDNPLFNSNLKF